MNQGKVIKLLRVSYWVGAIFDALVIIPMMLPTWIIQGMLVLLLSFSHLNAKKLNM